MCNWNPRSSEHLSETEAQMTGKTTTNTAETTGWVGGAKLRPGGPCFAFTAPSLAQAALPDTSAGVGWREIAKK